MNIIENQEFEGERPLFGKKDISLVNIKVLNGESSIKECHNVECKNSTFNGKYPFWHVKKARIENCQFDTGARAAIWYSSDLYMKDCMIIAPKMFRKVDKLMLENVTFTDAQETLWDCSNINLDNCKAVNGDYILMNSSNIHIFNFKLQGNYSFQYCKNIVIENSVLDSKDAFWESHNVTLINCEISGEYLGWHSTNLKLVNCKIKGTQPLCYAKNLELENCTFDKDCDLCFEYSTVKATITNEVTSIKNPISGTITANKIGQIIIDENAKDPNNCQIHEG